MDKENEGGFYEVLGIWLFFHLVKIMDANPNPSE